MTILGVDLSSNNKVFDFALAYQQGVRACYVKLGGDNIPRYVSGSYAGRVDLSRAHGMITGHYWVTGGHDPEAAAQFFVRNLRNVQPGDFFVLDNEVLDDGNMYSDDEAARWISTVQALVGGDRRRVFMYASGSPMRGSSWAAVRATGAQALVAWYDIGQWGFPQPLGSWPADQIGGHQFTSGANLGSGGRIDANVFKDNAFTFDGTSTAGLIGDEFDMASLDDLKDIVTASEGRELDATRRESRLWRLFRNTDRVGEPDEFVAVAFSLPPSDPRQVIYLAAGDVKSIGDTYQMTADTAKNARPLNARDIAALVRLANGTDRIYGTRPAS